MDEADQNPYEMSLDELAAEAYQIRSLGQKDATDLDSPGKRHEYADYLERVLAMRTEITAAEIQAKTNKELVAETQALVEQTNTVAKWTRMAVAVAAALVSTVIATIALYQAIQ